jgi:hypothetical protein
LRPWRPQLWLAPLYGQFSHTTFEVWKYPYYKELEETILFGLVAFGYLCPRLRPLSFYVMNIQFIRSPIIKEKLRKSLRLVHRPCFRKSKPKIPHRKARLQMQARTCSPTHQQSQSVGFSPFGSGVYPALLEKCGATPFVCLLSLKA